MSAIRDALSRRRQDLNPLATSIPLNPQPFQQTPISAIGLSSPNGGYYTAPYTSPATAVREYNPMQWGPSVVGTENAVRYPPVPADEVEGMF
jgi:hypothetical protein